MNTSYFQRNIGGSGLCLLGKAAHHRKAGTSAEGLAAAPLAHRCPAAAWAVARTIGPRIAARRPAMGSESKSAPGAPTASCLPLRAGAGRAAPVARLGPVPPRRAPGSDWPHALPSSSNGLSWAFPPGSRCDSHNTADPHATGALHVMRGHGGDLAFTDSRRCDKMY